MSRNFELLRRAGEEEAVFGGASTDSLPSNGGRPRLEQSGLARAEAVKLVQRVFVFPNALAPRTVLISGVDQGNTSSEICLRVGEVLAAEVSGSICLVDANLRAPSLHQLLGVTNCPGLSDATVEPGPIRDFAVRIAGGNLWVVPPGSSAAEAKGLFASERLRSRMVELRGEFDYVLIDGPAVSSYAGAVLLGQMADGVILVIEADSTRRETARKAKEVLESAKVRLLGAILNNRTFPIPEALYRKL